MAPDGDSPIARTRYGELSLDEIAEIQPGMARLMAEVSDRWWILYYAAKAQNWPMARHQYGELCKTLTIAALTRPKHKESLEGYTGEKLKPIDSAIRAQDWPSLESAFRDATDAANEMHVELGYEYIIWQLPGAPPPHLKLTP
jgi:hypothetical protein